MCVLLLVMIMVLIAILSNILRCFCCCCYQPDRSKTGLFAIIYEVVVSIMVVPGVDRGTEV